VDDTRRVVVQRGARFETANVVEAGPSHVRLKGGWPEGGFGPTAVLIVGGVEVETRVSESAAGEATLRPAGLGPWPPRILRELEGAITPPAS
jgi:hypothetical protein